MVGRAETLTARAVQPANSSHGSPPFEIGTDCSAALPCHSDKHRLPHRTPHRGPQLTLGLEPHCGEGRPAFSALRNCVLLRRSPRPFNGSRNRVRATRNWVLLRATTKPALVPALVPSGEQADTAAKPQRETRVSNHRWRTGALHPNHPQTRTSGHCPGTSSSCLLGNARITNPSGAHRQAGRI